MNAWHQGRSPGRKGKFTDLFLSFSLSFVLWFVLSTFVFTLLCSLSCPLSSSLHFFFSCYIWPSILPPCGAKSIGFHHHSAPHSITVFCHFCQKWFFHFQSAGLPSRLPILQILTQSCQCQDKYVRIQNKSEPDKLLASKLIEMVGRHTGLEWNTFISKTNSLFSAIV